MNFDRMFSDIGSFLLISGMAVAFIAALLAALLFLYALVMVVMVGGRPYLMSQHRRFKDALKVTRHQ